MPYNYCKFRNVREGFIFVKLPESKIKPSRNGEVTLSSTDVRKSCPSRRYVADMCFNNIHENKILTKISEFCSLSFTSMCHDKTFFSQYPAVNEHFSFDCLLN